MNTNSGQYNPVTHIHSMYAKRMPCGGKLEESFEKDLDIVVVHSDDESLEFDIIGIDVCYSNALRRLILSDVPTMAIQSVTVKKNRTLFPNEVFAHRFGLIPLKVDPRKFDFCPRNEYNDGNSIEFECKVKYHVKKESGKSSSSSSKIDNSKKVYSKQIKWCPIGNQVDIFQESDVGPIDSNIVLTRMKPGEEIDFKLIAIKSTGRDHAKFQPGLAYYRLCPVITLKREITGEAAHRLKSTLSPGVIDIKQEANKVVAFVKSSRYDFNSRNLNKHKDLSNAVEITKEFKHVIFTVESHSALKNDEIVTEALKVLMNKLEVLYNCLCN